MKRDILGEFGREDLFYRALPKYDDAIIGVITNGAEEGIAYDESKIPADELELIPAEDYIVELMPEDKALEALEGCLLFGSNGENEYEGAIIGITHGHFLYDYDAIIDCKMKQYVQFAENKDDDELYTDAVEDLDFNTLRAMPYYPEGPRILMYREIFEDEN